MKRLQIGISVVLLIAVLLLGIDGSTGAAEPPKIKHTLFASGDTNLARWVPHTVIEKGPEWPLKQVNHLSKTADIALTNLECVLSTTGYFKDKGERRPYLYRGRPEMIDVLYYGGFDVVTVANNHAMDYGGDALLEQILLLNACGIAAAGGGKDYREAAEPLYVWSEDLIVAIIALEDSFPKYAATETTPGIFHQKGMRNISRTLYPIIQEASKKADLVIFSPHWGANWTENVSAHRIKLARWLIDHGVDAILGHSSHQIHGIEIYKGHPIVYDMGTYFFDRVRQHRMRYSAGFTLEFNKNGFTKLIIQPIRLKTNRTQMPKRSEVAIVHDVIRRLSKEINKEIEFESNGDLLSISFEPLTTPKSDRTEIPVKVHKAGQTRRLPVDYRRKKSNVVLDKPPPWAKEFTAVSFNNGVRVMGAKNAQTV